MLSNFMEKTGPLKVPNEEQDAPSNRDLIPGLSLESTNAKCRKASRGDGRCREIRVTASTSPQPVCLQREDHKPSPAGRFEIAKEPEAGEQLLCAP